MKLLVLVVGATGQLGQVMADRLRAQHEVAALGRSELDVTSADAVREMIFDIYPDVIVNCSAYTDVDGAERDPLQALAVNSWGPRLLARAARDIEATLVHYSTDFVFDGTTDTPYGEDDAPNPRGSYAMSKLLGEWFVAESPRHYVLRVESLFGGRHARSSIDFMLSRLRAGTPVRAFVDRTVSPSYVEDVVEATCALVERQAPYGLYHCVNSGWTNWTGVARELARLIGKPAATIEEIKMADAGLVATRPQFAALTNAKLAAAGITLPTWQDALARYVNGGTAAAG
ncbi:MAG: dTDP-4-dehydrorhamnose reductase [Vicinamibacterales bacterium]